MIGEFLAEPLSQDNPHFLMPSRLTATLERG